MQSKTNKIDVAIRIDRDLDERIKNEILPYMPLDAFFSKAIEVGIETFRNLPFDPVNERLIVAVYTKSKREVMEI